MTGGSPTGAALHDDVGSADEHGDLDLSPRTSGPGGGNGGGAGEVVYGRRRGGGSTRKWPWLAVLGVVVVAIGFVIFHAVNDAAVFYLNTDEAISRQAELGGKTFRMQGTVVEHSVQKTQDGSGTTFKIAYNGAEASVFETGDPPQLFQDCIPVVLNGHWQGSGSTAVFQSDQIIVAHDSNYEAANSDRIKQAEAQAAQNGGERAGACVVKDLDKTP
jgi:cytochrome c-type biogenesis protein CcmE